MKLSILSLWKHPPQTASENALGFQSLYMKAFFQAQELFDQWPVLWSPTRPHLLCIDSVPKTTICQLWFRSTDLALRFARIGWHFERCLFECHLFFRTIPSWNWMTFLTARSWNHSIICGILPSQFCALSGVEIFIWNLELLSFLLFWHLNRLILTWTSRFRKWMFKYISSCPLWPEFWITSFACLSEPTPCRIKQPVSAVYPEHCSCPSSSNSKSY